MSEHKKDPSRYISTDASWTPETLEAFYDAIEDIAVGKYGLDVYPNQLEIITSEQMIDAYASVAMPVMYNHWTFAKQFVETEAKYKAGQMGLAYEVVINSNPCISYLMEDNTMLMQALVIAHACFGHNTFFKTNYLFQTWTDADSILDYLEFAKHQIAKFEEQYGPKEVEQVLDSCHALQLYGVDRYKRPAPLTMAEEKVRQEERAHARQQQVNELWASVIPREASKVEEKTQRFPSEPEENILLFVEQNAPFLEDWKRECIRIVRTIAQYFYPQRQTQLMNEGCATFWHYTIMMELHARGQIDDGYMMEFLDSHTGVTFQPGFDSKFYSGINVYALGFAMFKDIKRICMEPTDEDREWFPEFAGNGDWVNTIKRVCKDYKDESFVSQFLSPAVIREFKLFAILDDENDTEMEITAIHSRAGYERVREVLSQQYNSVENTPNIQVYDVDARGTRALTLRHYLHNNVPLDQHNTQETLKHLRMLWGFDVNLESVTPDEQQVTVSYHVSDTNCTVDVFS